MCEGQINEELTEAIGEQLRDRSASQDNDLTGLSTAYADSYLGDYWGLGFGDRPHFD